MVESESTTSSGILVADAHSHYSAQRDIISSLKPEAENPLIVRSDGMVMNGNTRIYVLMSRGVDVDALPWVPYTSELPPGWLH